MARAKEQYAIGILFNGGKIKYVTKVLEHNWAQWEDGEEAITFSKAMAIDMCRGFAWNGISAIPILHQDFITLRNDKQEEGL